MGSHGAAAHLDEVGLDEAADEDTVELEVAEPPAAPATCESRPARAIALQGGVNPDAKRESAAADRWSAAAGVSSEVAAGALEGVRGWKLSKRLGLEPCWWPEPREPCHWKAVSTSTTRLRHATQTLH